MKKTLIIKGTRLELRNQIEKEIYDSPIWQSWKCNNKKHQDVIDLARSIEAIFNFIQTT